MLIFKKIMTMKKIFKLTLIMSMAMLFSCSDDFLNKYPLDKISGGNFDPDLVLTGAYAKLMQNEISQEMATFDGITPINYTRFGQWNNLSKGSANSYHGRTARLWNSLYDGIFRTNDFLMNIEGFGGMTDDEKAVYIGEARFLRGYYYHRLVAAFGDVPLVVKPLTIEEARQVVRAPKADVIAQILEDLDYAEDNLDVEPRLVGTATQGAAMALKARVHLYESNWQGVKAEAQKVMDLNYYNLYQGDLDSLNFEKVFDFRNENNVEVIFDVQYDAPDKGMGNIWQTYINGKAHQINPGYVRSTPTMFLVNKFERRDGQQPASETDFSNRDYRFYASILYPGAIYNGEQDPTGMLSQSNTGMNQRKYTIENDQEHLTNRFDSPTNFILIRYADVLLMYAEAQNELVGPDASAYEAVNKVRSRAGLPDLAGLSQAELRQEIHEERITELAFEGLHLWDMWRWGKAGTLEGSMDAQAYVETFQPTGISGQRPQTSVFDPVRDYLWPIPQDEIDNIPTLTQNPGW
jgi:hypothetical protein